MSLGNGHGNGKGSLEGRVALVTGAARGIGRAIAFDLAYRGAAVAVNFRTSQDAAENLAVQMEEIGADCMLVKGDVVYQADASRIVDEVLDAWKRLDILVNNAGITLDKTHRKASDDDWADVINVNLNGTRHCTNAVLPVMIQQKFGRIVNISSCMRQAGNFGQTASDGEIIAFTRALALEVAKHNITVNAVAPGFTCTEMLAGLPPNILEQIRSKIPLGRLANPDEIGKAVSFLAADGAYITGQQLSVNGGLYM